jgi:hypothetical protein
MKTILSTIYDFFTAMGKAKAATALARMGNYEAAKNVMIEK